MTNEPGSSARHQPAPDDGSFINEADIRPTRADESYTEGTNISFAQGEVEVNNPDAAVLPRMSAPRPDSTSTFSSLPPRQSHGNHGIGISTGARVRSVDNDARSAPGSRSIPIDLLDPPRARQRRRAAPSTSRAPSATSLANMNEAAAMGEAGGARRRQKAAVQPALGISSLAPSDSTFWQPEVVSSFDPAIDNTSNQSVVPTISSMTTAMPSRNAGSDPQASSAHAQMGSQSVFSSITMDMSGGNAGSGSPASSVQAQGGGQNFINGVAVGSVFSSDNSINTTVSRPRRRRHALQNSAQSTVQSSTHGVQFPAYNRLGEQSRIRIRQQHRDASMSTRQAPGSSQRGRNYNPPRRVKLTKFNKFLELPKELQIKIWELQIPGPRIIELVAKTYVTEHDHDDCIGNAVDWEYDRCFSKADHPAILHVNRDSRAEALKIYKLCFEEELRWPVYMDPDRDVLLFPEINALDIFATSVPRPVDAMPSSLTGIKYVIVDPRCVFTTGNRSQIDRERALLQYNFPSYRFDEIAAVYGNIPEIVVLKYPQGHHLAPLPPQLNMAPVPNRTDTAGVDRHLSMLLRWSMQRAPPAPGNANNAPLLAFNPLPLQAAPANAAQANAIAAQMAAANPGLTPAQLNALLTQMGLGGMGNVPLAPGQWRVPSVVSMTLDDVRARMDLWMFEGEREDEDGVESAL